MGSVRLVVGGVGKSREGVGYVGIASSTRRVVGRRRYESVTRSFISHPTSWSFPKRSQTTKGEKKKEKQGERLSHSFPTHKKKGGGPISKTIMTSHLHTGSAVTRPASLLFFFFFFFFYIFIPPLLLLLVSLLSEPISWPCVRTLCAFLWRLLFNFFSPRLLLLLYV